MLLPTLNFRDYAAARIAKTLLAVFFHRSTLFGAQFSFSHIVANAYRFADQLAEQRREDDRLNELAVTLLEGMLFGFYDNRQEHKNWSSMVHNHRIPLFIRDAYRMAELMVARSQQTPETQDAPAAVGVAKSVSHRSNP